MAELTTTLMGRGHAPDEIVGDVAGGAWLATLVIRLFHLPSLF